MKKKIALLGGAFDPPHFGHAACVSSALNSGFVDEVWFLPCNDKRYDKHAAVSADDRVHMIKLLIDECFDSTQTVKVCNLQLEERFQDSAAIDILDYLSTENKDSEFMFLIGADLASQLGNWRRSEDLLRKYKFIIAPRPGYLVKKNIASFLEIKPEDSFQYDYSSTRVREVLKGSQELGGIVPKSVVKYVKTRHFYK